MCSFKTIHTLSFDTIDSTHSWGKKNIYTLDPDVLTCISAKEQTSGYGRKGRGWHSFNGLNLALTLCFTLPRAAAFVGNLGQLLCLSAASYLQAQGFHPEIKWPNDVRIESKKIAGILCETVRQNEKIGVVLSIGFNVNMPREFLAEIDQPATSLEALSGHSWDIDAIRQALIEQFVRDFEILQTQGFAPLRDRYDQLLAFKGESISCFDGVRQVTGICRSVHADGRLELLLPSGEILLISAGDISLNC